MYYFEGCSDSLVYHRCTKGCNYWKSNNKCESKFQSLWTGALVDCKDKKSWFKDKFAKNMCKKSCKLCGEQIIFQIFCSYIILLLRYDWRICAYTFVFDSNKPMVAGVIGVHTLDAPKHVVWDNGKKVECVQEPMEEV